MVRVEVGRLDEPEGAASSGEMGRFETEWLPDIMNYEAVRTLPGAWVQRTQHYCPVGRIVLDMDSSGSPTHGNQEGAAYNGHLDMKGYHPLFCFNQFGDLEGTMLRPGKCPQRRGMEETAGADRRALSWTGHRSLFPG